MVRDPGLEELLRTDLGDLPGLSEKPMFGGLCFMMNGHMLCAAREGGLMYRVGKSNDSLALSLPGVSRMVLGGGAKPGFVLLDETNLEDDEIRATLAGFALMNARDLPPKE